MTSKKYMETEATSIIANVTCCLSQRGNYIAYLDETIFHPQGGGQPSDIGYIGTAKVFKVEDNQGTIEHYIDTPIDVGPTQIAINQELRVLHSKLHSIGHLIGNIGASFGWSPSKAHHWPNECRVEFVQGDNATSLTAEDFQKKYSVLIDSNAELKVEENSKGQRLVSFGDLKAWSCGGTHVSSFRELPNNLIISVKYKKQKMIVRYDMEGSH